MARSEGPRLKIDEERRIEQAANDESAGEVGDLLFAVVNMPATSAEPETALREATAI